MIADERQIQAAWYGKIAARYDQVHADAEHEVAFWQLTGMLSLIGATSVLDVGAGAGRVLLKLKERAPGLRVAGVEPVAALRQAGYDKGLLPEDLADGDGYRLAFDDGEFDVVCEFGVLHHVRHPNRVVSEMLRVAKKAIFISDSNNFGAGSAMGRLAKQTLHKAGLWRLATYLKTRGRGYSISAGDGLFYPYSVFDSLDLIASQCASVHLMNTRPAGANLYRTADHLAVFASKTASRAR